MIQANISHKVRTTRSRIIYLKNDYKALMSVIEKHIHEHFARLAEEPTAEEPVMTRAQATEMVASFDEPAPLDLPFAKVNSVAAGSPADDAGLKAGDIIRNFGYVNHGNHDGLKRVGECVQGNESVSVPNHFQICEDFTDLYPTIARSYSKSFTEFGTPRATTNLNATKRLGRQRASGLSYSAIVGQN